MWAQLWAQAVAQVPALAQQLLGGQQQAQAFMQLQAQGLQDWLD
jgi:hypothetical protein